MSAAVLLVLVTAAVFEYSLASNQVQSFEIATSPYVVATGQSSNDPCASVTRQSYNVTSFSNPPEANFTKQVWAILGQGGNKLEANVTAVAQSDAFGYGLSYWLNGQSDKGLWYQVGIAWNWPLGTDRGFISGFSLLAQVWNPNNELVYNYKHALTVKGGDTISLRLNVSKDSNEVTMGLRDYSRSGVDFYTAFGSSGASDFVATFNQSDHPTSFLMETYGATIVCSQDPTVFAGFSTSSRIQLRIDEWNFTNTPLNERFVSNPSSPQWSLFPAPSQMGKSSPYCLSYLGTKECADRA